jgi:hypothetical protein
MSVNNNFSRFLGVGFQDQRSANRKGKNKTSFHKLGGFNRLKVEICQDFSRLRLIAIDMG